MKKTAEMFHERIRWRDYPGAAELIVPDRRLLFESARQKLDDDHNLSITDYELEGVRFSSDGKRGWVVSRVSWMRLPSASEKNARIDSEYVWQNAGWLLVRQSAGPFAEELGAEYPRH